jgi:hypothetical protein
VSASPAKQSYTVSCATDFRDAVVDLARRCRVNVGDLARSVFLTVPPEAIAAFPDPGEPGRDDREAVVLKSGRSAGRPWRRKPRLQVRMPSGYPLPMVRRALGLALALDAGALTLRLEAAPGRGGDLGSATPTTGGDADGDAGEELERLRAIVSVLAFEPLADGVRDRTDALHVLGFAPGSRPGRRALRARFRMLAAIHHPDGPHGSHRRMSQLNAAMALLRGD